MSKIKTRIVDSCSSLITLHSSFPHSPFLRRLNVLHGHDAQRLQASSIASQYFEIESTEREAFAAPRQTPEIAHDKSADGVEFLIAELRTEVIVEIADTSLRLHRKLTLAFLADIKVVVDVVFIADVADNLLQHVFDGHESSNATVFIDDKCHVIVVGAKLFK